MPENQTSHIRKNKTELNDTELNDTSSSASVGKAEDDEDENKLLIIDRDKLVDEFISRHTALNGWDKMLRYRAEVVVGSILSALHMLVQEDSPESRLFAQMSDTSMLSHFLADISDLDLSDVRNTTAYMKRVLLEFLRKRAVLDTDASISGKPSEASYDLKEIDNFMNSEVIFDASSP